VTNSTSQKKLFRCANTRIGAPRWTPTQYFSVVVTDSPERDLKLAQAVLVTVKNHMLELHQNYQKLNVFNRPQAVFKVTRVCFDV